MTVFLKVSDNGADFKIEHYCHGNELCIEVEYWFEYGGKSTAEISLTFEQVKVIYETMKSANNGRNLKGLGCEKA